MAFVVNHHTPFGSTLSSTSRWLETDEAVATGWQSPSVQFPRNLDGLDSQLHICIRDDDIPGLKLRLTDRSEAAPKLGLTPRWSSPLHFAAWYGSLPAVEALLAAGADPWLRDETGYAHDWHSNASPFSLAVRKKHRQIASCIWHNSGSHRDTVDGIERLRREHLQDAVWYGDAAIVHDLLTWRTDWDQDDWVDSLVRAASRWEPHVTGTLIRLKPEPYEQGELDSALRAARLISSGADPNSLLDGMTPLYRASLDQDLTGAVKILLEAGADPNKRSQNGRTALHRVASMVPGLQSIEMSEGLNETAVRLLLQHRASAILPSADDGTTPLHEAACGPNCHLFDIFLSSCPNLDVALNVQNDLEESLLHFAALGGRIDILKVLLSHNLDVNQRTATGWTPLMFALAPDRRPEEHLDYKTIFHATRASRLLLEHGADASVVAGGGWTPLHVLSLHKDIRISTGIIRLGNELLQESNGISALEPIPTDSQWHGLSKLHRSWDDPGRNMTLLHWAAEHGCTAMVRILIDNGADVLAQDTRGLTPAMACSRSSVIGYDPENVRITREMLAAAGGEEEAPV